MTTPQMEWKKEFIEKFTDKVDSENDYYDSQFTEGRPSRVLDFIQENFIPKAELTKWLEEQK